MKYNFTKTSYKDWKDTKNTYHLFFQILGKINLSLNVKRNHWWHIGYRITPNGLTSGPLPTQKGILEIRINLLQHKVNFITKNQTETINLVDKLSVKEYYNQVLRILEKLEIKAQISDKPYDNHSKIKFSEDDTNSTYDKEAIENYFNNLSQAHLILQKVQAHFKSKMSPINNFWHSFDIATTFFTGDLGPSTEGWDPVAAEAYSDEVVSFGWWPGDHMYEEAAFYAYIYPDPENSQKIPLKPSQAFWIEKNGAGLALLKHDDILKEKDPENIILEFFKNFFEEAIKATHWSKNNKLYKPN